MLHFFARWPRHLRLGAQVGVAVVLIFAALLGYALRTAPRFSRESQQTLDAFYRDCQRHDYAAAYQMLAPELRDSMTQTEMAHRFLQFEKTNGTIERWAPAAGGSIHFGGRVCLFPPFVDYTHRLIGVHHKAMGEATVVYVRVVPRQNIWQIQKLSFMR